MSQMTIEEIKKCADFFWSKISHYYRNQFLPYHNHKHIETCLDNYYLFRKQPVLEEVLAILFHDIVYFPKIWPGRNEFYSAEIAKNFIEYNSDNYKIDVDLVYFIIANTSVDVHLSNDGMFDIMSATSMVAMTLDKVERYTDSLKVVLDADLSSMACDYTEFVQNQKHIVYEQTFDTEVDMNESLRKCGSFLKQFEDKEFIYRTPEARAMFEQRAKQNIAMFRSEYGN